MNDSILVDFNGNLTNKENRLTHKRERGVKLIRSSQFLYKLTGIPRFRSRCSIISG